ncbi:hypothetical protein C0993_000493, partial [Termitomyces sp. T159_Od127]
VLVSQELFDEIEHKWAPRNDSVFQLVSPAFEHQVVALYDNLGKPAVSSDTFWDIYADLLAAFQLLPHNPQLQAAFSNADLNLEDDVPLIAGLKDLCHGDAVGDLGYHYYGGLAEPPVAENTIGSDGYEDSYVDNNDLHDYVDFSDVDTD